MKKPLVLWVGENSPRCLTLMGIYAGLIRSVYAENTDKGFLREAAKGVCAIVLALNSDERADTPVCREIYSYSAKKHIPVYMMAQRRHLRIAAALCPNAVLSLVQDDRLAEVFTENEPRAPVFSAPLPAVAVFSEMTECFVYLEKQLSAELRGRLRLLYSEPTAEVIGRMKRKGIKPKLIVFGEDICKGPRRAFFEALYRQADFRKIPYLLFYASDAVPEADSEREPLAVVDIRKEASEIEEIVRAAVGLK